MGTESASSCSLYYKLPNSASDQCKYWTLETTVNVEKSTKCTYFCVLGWHRHGGFTGIQELRGKKVAIFSMWDDDKHSVELVDSGPGSNVTVFKQGQETGLKCMKDFAWNNNTPVTFKVSGRKEEDYWIWSCHYTYLRETHLLATYKKKSLRFLSPSDLYSFIRDFGGLGNSFQRSAYFYNQRLTVDDNVIAINSALYCKSKGDARKVAGEVKDNMFYMCTGGQDRASAANGTLLEYS